MTVLLALLVRLYPRAFRERFGAELERHARDSIAAEWARGLGPGAVRVAFVTMDLITSAIAEHVRPTWDERVATNTTRQGAGMMVMEWIRELRHAGRSLARSPGFAASSLLTLGIALGANASIFSVVDKILLEPLPYEQPDELVTLLASSPGSDLPEEFGLGAEFYLDFRDEATTLDGIAVFNSFTATFRTSDRVERIRMSSPDVSLFDVLGAQPSIGRVPDPERDEAAISHAMWTNWFGQDPTVIGRTYQMLDGRSREIVGVMAPEFEFPNAGVMVWVPTTWSAENVQVGQFGLNLVARRAEGASSAAVVDELRTIALRAPEKWGGSAQYAEAVSNLIPIVEPLEDALIGEARAPLWIMMLAAAGVLLIACANIANLFAVRSDSRGRDLAVRRAIGAGRRHLIRSQLAEAVVLSTAAGLLALVVAWFAIPGLVSVIPDFLPGLDRVGLTPEVALFTFGLAVLTALACGLVPAVRASRPNLARLRDGSRGSTRRGSLGRDLLVISQTALALVLLTGSGLLIRSFQKVYAVDPGYDVENVFTFQFAPEEAHLTDGPTWAAFHVDMMNRFAALPGVESVGIVENVPLDESARDARLSTGADPDPAAARLGSVTMAGGDYFATMGIDVLAGRPFTTDDAFTPGNAVISQAAADMLWPGEDPVGRQVVTSLLPDEWHTVVGVVENVLQLDLRAEPAPLVYLPLVFENPQAQLTSPGYVVKTERASTIAPDIRAIIREVSPSAPMYRAYTMDGLLDRSAGALTFTMITLVLAAGLSLVLGSIGLFGVLSYVVNQRRREIGVRIALGAEASRVQRMVIGQGARVVGIGVVVGAVVAVAATRLMEGLLFGVGALDPVTFLASTSVMLGVGLIASWLPARRAAAIDPLVSMRAD